MNEVFELLMRIIARLHELERRVEVIERKLNHKGTGREDW